MPTCQLDGVYLDSESMVRVVVNGIPIWLCHLHDSITKKDLEGVAGYLCSLALPERGFHNWGKSISRAVPAST